MNINKEKYFGIDPQLPEPKKIKSVTVKYKGGSKKQDNLQNTYVQLSNRRTTKYESYFLRMEHRDISLIIYSNELRIIDCGMLRDSVISFEVEDLLQTELFFSDKFLPFKYSLGEVYFSDMLIDNLVDLYISGSLSELNKYTLQLKLNLNNNIFYNMNFKEKPIKFTRHSIDGKEQLIVNEPEVIYLIKDNKRYYKGISKCNTEDKFDIKKGIEIAKLRTEIKQKEYKIKELTQ